MWYSTMVQKRNLIRYSFCCQTLFKARERTNFPVWNAELLYLILITDTIRQSWNAAAGLRIILNS